MNNIKEFYREKYAGSLFVVKAGGRIITDDTARRSLLSNIKDLSEAGIKVLLIYGGGHAIDAALERGGIELQKINGRRVTTSQAIDVIEQVMTKELRALLDDDFTALSIEGDILNHLPAAWGRLGFRPRANQDDYGYDGFYAEVFEDALRANFADTNFIVCPCLGVSDKGFVNINADNVAMALASGAHTRKLIFLSDVDGVMKDGALINLLTDKDIPALIESGVAAGGMRVKLENCLDALNAGVRRIHLINGFKENALTDEVYDAIGHGTMIIRADSRDHYMQEIKTQKDIEGHAA